MNQKIDENGSKMDPKGFKVDQSRQKTDKKLAKNESNITKNGPKMASNWHYTSFDNKAAIFFSLMLMANLTNWLVSTKPIIKFIICGLIICKTSQKIFIAAPWKNIGPKVLIIEGSTDTPVVFLISSSVRKFKLPRVLPNEVEVLTGIFWVWDFCRAFRTAGPKWASNFGTWPRDVSSGSRSHKLSAVNGFLKPGIKISI